MPAADVLVQQLINGLALGAMYGLFGVGFTLIYGIMELINFAHFSVFVAGAFIALAVGNMLIGPTDNFALTNALYIPAIAVVLLAVVLGSGLLGAGVQLVMRPLRGVSGPGPLIATVGISFVIQNFILLVAGPRNFAFPGLFPSITWTFGTIQVRAAQIVVAVAAVAGFAGLRWFIDRTKAGRAMRAVRDDPEAAQMMGVEIEQVIRATFFISGALAGVAGLIFGVYYGQLQYGSGYTVGLRAFTAAVLGGIGNPLGSMIGGLVVGIAESLGGQFIGVGWSPIVIYGLLILTLLLRPTGLFAARRSSRA